MKRIVITGSRGFIGKNLVEALRRVPDVAILEYDIEDGESILVAQLDVADAVFHLAGVNRPKREEEFADVNAGLTSRIVRRLSGRTRKPLLVLTSSTQAQLDNAYGRSKRDAEKLLEEYGEAGGTGVVFRLSNVFGKWSRPDYNSVVATFCHNITHELEITVSDPARTVELVYVDDVVKALIAQLAEPDRPGVRFATAGPVSRITLETLANELYVFRDIRTRLELPDLQDRFRRALYATYLSFLPEEDFAYRLVKREDQRGSLAEILKSHHAGQLFVSRTNPGIVRGNHFHDTKIEKFCVLEGDAVIRFRHVLGGDVVSYHVKGTEYRVVDIPPGYTHSIENVGSTVLVVLFWASEVFDSSAPDTYQLPVVS